MGKKSKNFDYKVVYSGNCLKKKDIYVKVPKTLVREVGQTKAEKESWFGYHSKHYHPLCLQDSSGKTFMGTKNAIMKLTIQSEVDGMHLAESACKADKSGIFWFKSVRAFIFGKMTLTFDIELAGATAEPLVETVEVEFDAQGRTLEEIPVEDVEGGKSSSKKKKKKKAVDEDEDEDEDEDQDEDDDDFVDDTPSKGEKKRKSSGGGPAEKGGGSPSKKAKKDGAAAGAGGKEHEGKGASSRPKKLKKNASLRMDNVLSIPNSSVLGGKNHLRPAQIQEVIQECGATGKKGEVIINGAQLVINLAPSLVHALVKDKIRVSQLAAIVDKAPSEGARLLTEESNMHRPTANELFQKLYNKTAHIPEVENVLGQLRCLFEYVFESSLLYVEEKKVYKNLISNIKADEGKFADNFGVYYYLRFLVFVATEADFLVHLDVDQDGSAVAGTAGSVSSQRTKAVSDRHYKALFSTAQQLLDNAVRDLDDSAIALFA